MTKFVGVVCSKGGVGRTIISLNLAHVLQNLGYNVLVLDCDFSSPNIPIYLGLVATKKTLHHLLRGECSIHEAITLHESGIRVLPGSISYSDSKISDVDLLEKVFCELEGFDIVLVDTPPGFNANVDTALKLMDSLLFVTTPELSAVTDCLRTIKHAKEHKKQRLGVIINKSRGDALDMAPEVIENFLSEKVIGVIPYDNEIRNSLYLRQPVVYAYPDAPSSIAFKKLGANLTGAAYTETKNAPAHTQDVQTGKHILSKTLYDFSNFQLPSHDH